MRYKPSIFPFISLNGSQEPEFKEEYIKAHGKEAYEMHMQGLKKRVERLNTNATETPDGSTIPVGTKLESLKRRLAISRSAKFRKRFIKIQEQSMYHQLIEELETSFEATGEFQTEFSESDLLKGLKQDLEDLISRRDFWIKEYGLETYDLLVATYKEIGN